jgi:acetyltransferase-like isoleucine patch superfamily enzyme
MKDCLRLISEDVVLGSNVQIMPFVNLYGCSIGDDTKIGPFVEIQRNVNIGRGCKISSHTFLCEGVTIGNNVFIGHHVVFVNDRYPRATNELGAPKGAGDWNLETTAVDDGASIGSGAVILCGTRIGKGALVGAGSVVTRDVPDNTVVAGNPAQVLRKINQVRPE